MTILAAVGGDQEQDRVVEVGYDLATKYDDDLVVLHVMEEEQFKDLQGSEISGPVVVPGVDEATGIAYVDSGRTATTYTIEDAVSDSKDVAQEIVSRTISEEHQTHVSTDARVGNPATEIVKVSKELDARFVVVGGRKRSPTGKAVFGSVSQSVILNSDRPVVTITRDE